MNKLYFLGLAALAAIPVRAGLVSGDVIGAGPDVISTLWGMWWFQQEGIDSLLGKQSILANYPNGVFGSVLSPTSALVWSLVEPLLGAGRALAVVVWLQVLLFAWGCTLLAKAVGVDEPWHWVAGVVVLVSRYVFFGIGEASIVAVVAASIPFGLLALVQLLGARNIVWNYLLLVSMIAVTALENPYLAPVLPGATVLLALWYPEHRKGLLVSLGAGMFLLLSIAQSFGATANPDYPREVAGQVVSLLGRDWTVVDLPWARLRLEELAWPSTVEWTTNASNATQASGGRYLGITTIVLSIIGCRQRKSYPFLLMMLGCIFLSLGSVQYNCAFPFLILNALMDAIARPLTQPTRFLAVALVGAGVLVAMGVQYLNARKSVLGALCVVGLLGEGFVFGGLGLTLPTTQMPTVSCDFSTEKGVLLWPYDAEDGELGISQLYQMQHGYPSVQTGIASWKLDGDRVFEKIRGAGFVSNTTGWNVRRLRDAGFDVVLVEKGVESPVDVSRAEDCGDVLLVRLQR